MLPINRNLHSSPFINNSQISPTSASLLIEQWKEWEKQSQPGAGEERDIALLRLIECLENHPNRLNLQELNLTELPAAFPDTVKKLNLSYNKLVQFPETFPPQIEYLYADNNLLTQLPERLPMSIKLLDIRFNQLTHLPTILPEGLIYLIMDGNRISQLPERLPPHLNLLQADYNQLTHLPEMLPSDLRLLRAANNQLTSLPEILPTELITLILNHNHLTQLPERLPPHLNLLQADYNQLTHLPEMLPSDLKLIHVANNQITHLPENLPPRLIALNVHNNPLILEALAASLSTQERLNHFLLFNTFSPSSLIVTLSLWDKNSDITRWEKIAQEENADHFSHFLKKLHTERNASNTQLHCIVSQWLNELAKEENRELRTQIFAIARLGAESCVDRASYYFNQMHSLLIEHRLTNTSVSISEIITALRGLFRLQTLEKISAHHVEQRRRIDPDFKEDIEIYLAYQYKLQEELALPVSSELQFDTIARLTPADLTHAKHQIFEIEKEEFLRHLVNHSEVWGKKIETWNSEKWKLANEWYLKEIVSPEFQQQIEEALKKESISTGDEDAVRMMQQKMASDLLFNIRYPLTEAFLSEQKALSLLNELVL